MKTVEDYRKYKLKVKRITNKQRLHTLPNYELRGRTGISGAYHLDHIYSISQGFINNIPEHVIGDIKNLRFIPWENNISKSGKLTNESWDMFVYFIEEEMI
tara:strand:+ start:1235 stop:1537 length:303 start_codon:yes stop_codon:yes gene_type:complete